jgi:hypothetical protein
VLILGSWLSIAWLVSCPSLADSNNKNLGNTPAEIQRNQTLVNSNNQDYAKIDKSKGEDSAIIRYATFNLFAIIIIPILRRLSIRHWRTSSSHLRNIINFRNIARIIILSTITNLINNETSHTIDNQDPSIDTNPQNNASKADNEIFLCISAGVLPRFLLLLSAKLPSP